MSLKAILSQARLLGEAREQIKALQKTGTKLVERVRELEAEQTGDRSRVKYLLGKIKRLEQDGKRLDLIIEHLLIIHPPTPPMDLWEVCAYELPNPVDCLAKDKDLRQALDKAMAKGDKVP